MDAEHHQPAGTALLGLAAGQGLYYVVTGIWPLISMRTFELVTGPKTDHWLVKTVGLLAAGFGGVLLRDARRGQVDPGLGLAAALAFGASSLWYGGTGQVRRVYLADGVAEAVLVGAWLAAGRLRGSAHMTPNPAPRDG
jgi:hypothetical protein